MAGIFIFDPSSIESLAKKRTSVHVCYSNGGEISRFIGRFAQLMDFCAAIYRNALVPLRYDTVIQLCRFTNRLLAAHLSFYLSARVNRQYRRAAFFN
jgi:hypothetical protein